MKSIVLLHQYFAKIGGIETFIFNFCKTFHKDYEITLVCKNIGWKNAITLAEYANVICVPTPIECDTLIVTSAYIDKAFLRDIKAKHVYYMVHCDWEEIKPFWKTLKIPDYGNNTVISVSKSAQKGLKGATGKDSIVIPNLIIKPEKKKILRLISATRLTCEKGYDRMVKLCDLFEAAGICYEWDIYTSNADNETSYKNMKIKEPIPNISEYFNNYDYLVQLSDSESFCYSMYEALTLGVPVLVTPFPPAVETIKDGENGYILPFDMNITGEKIEKIVKNIPQNVSYEQRGVIEKWKKLLN